jgi:hypothetical protein
MPGSSVTSQYLLSYSILGDRGRRDEGRAVYRSKFLLFFKTRAVNDLLFVYLCADMSLPFSYYEKTNEGMN